jgi:hypothetical protein
MFQELLSLNQEPIPLFLAYHLHFHDLLSLIDIVQDSVIAQAKLPTSHWVRPKLFQPARPFSRLIA